MSVSVQEVEERLKRRYFIMPDFQVSAEEIRRLCDYMAAKVPVEFEIGSGKTKYLVSRARQHPGRRFIATDRVGKWLNYGRKAAEREGLENMLFLKADAIEMIRRHVPEGRMAIFHVYFPDPWPKTRQQKRRLVTADFVRLLHHRLRPGGYVRLATDDESYYRWMQQAAGESGCGWQVFKSVNERLEKGDFVKTNYEFKYESAGKNLYYMDLQKQ